MHMRTFTNTSMSCIQVETRPWTIELPSRKLEIDLTTVSSNHHVELNPSDAGNNDRYVVQEVIKVSGAFRRGIGCCVRIKAIELGCTKCIQHFPACHHPRNSPCAGQKSAQLHPTCQLSGPLLVQ